MFFLVWNWGLMYNDMKLWGHRNSVRINGQWRDLGWILCSTLELMEEYKWATFVSHATSRIVARTLCYLWAGMRLMYLLTINMGVGLGILVRDQAGDTLASMVTQIGTREDQVLSVLSKLNRALEFGAKLVLWDIILKCTKHSILQLLKGPSHCYSAWNHLVDDLREKKWGIFR